MGLKTKIVLERLYNFNAVEYSNIQPEDLLYLDCDGIFAKCGSI
jgi:hypothetical protein